MVRVIGGTLPYSQYDKFFLLHSRSLRYTSEIIGLFKKCGRHFIARSDNDDEIKVWADLNDIKIEKSINNYDRLLLKDFGKFEEIQDI